MSGEPEVMVRIEDLRAAGICVLGARRWMRENGLDFAEWLRTDQLSSKIVRRIGSTMAERVCQAAERRVAEEQANGVVR